MTDLSVRERAEARAVRDCTHPDEWTEHVDACWGCQVDAWFDVKTGWGHDVARSDLSLSEGDV